MELISFFATKSAGDATDLYVSYDIYRVGSSTSKYLQGLIAVPLHLIPKYGSNNINGTFYAVNPHNGISVRNNGVNLGEITTEISGKTMADFKRGAAYYINFTPLIISQLYTGTN